MWDIDPVNLDDFNRKLVDWLIEYNNIRPHETLDYLTPIEYIDNHLPAGVLPMSPSYTIFCILATIHI